MTSSARFDIVNLPMMPRQAARVAMPLARVAPHVIRMPTSRVRRAVDIASCPKMPMPTIKWALGGSRQPAGDELG
jgi:hypothetical protein